MCDYCSSGCFGFAKQFEEPHLKCTILMGSNCIVMIVNFLIAKSAQQSIHHAIYGPVIYNHAIYNHIYLHIQPVWVAASTFLSF